MNQIALAGCTATPLANYLKALGVLRLLATRQPETRGFWRDDRFVLSTPLAEQGVADFFLEHYAPTPIMAPWNGGSGFYVKDNKSALQSIKDSGSERFAAYRQALSAAEEVMAGLPRDASPKGDEKVRLLSMVRGMIPDAALDWFDASVVLAGDTAQYPPLLGTGGNDGRLDFTNNFMQRLTEVLPLGAEPATTAACDWLSTALFATAAPNLVKKAIGQFSPSQAGGPNASTGFESEGAMNPWDFVLMVEGALLFAAAAARRNAAGPSGVLSYPFTVRAVFAGAGNVGEGDTARGEIWMPLWQKPASCPEVRALLTEGRVALGKKPARDALDFVRAVHHLGGYRGVRSFQRFGILKRNGDAHFATPLMRVNVDDEHAPGLLDGLDRNEWLDRFRQFARGDDTPKRFLTLRRQLEDRLFDLSSRDPTPAEMQSLLVLLGEIQHALARSSRAREAVAPIPRLSGRWVTAADDGSVEFRIARALAGLRGVGDVALPLRAQLFPVQRTLDRWMTPEADEAVRIHVGGGGRLTELMANWLNRRLWLMEKLGMQDKPLSSPAGAMAEDVTAFLQDPRMDARILALLTGLSLCDIPQDAQRGAGEGRLPAAFGLMKLALTPDRDLRSLGHLSEGEHAPPPAGLLAVLMAGNPGNRAVALAWRRLRASGLTPHLGGTLPTLAGIDSTRAAAALLIPLRWAATATLARSLLEEPEARTSTASTTD
ncbi:MAG: type I-U CRISPR-associated protein Csx17 [Rubrivivax sp.]|nr:type I-U CRISPR-associated protein Csx17 [Rubrivivax sp.]